MLKSLYIKNYILIDETTIPFHEGLTVITGETGAGKSILLDAIGLLLGQRAEQAILRDPSQKCVVEGFFDALPEEIPPILGENGIDTDEEMIIRREILPGGKSRSFINDVPTTLNVLKQVGEYLMDIHSQHQTLFLAHPDFQIKMLDLLAQQNNSIKKFQKDYQTWTNLHRQLEKLQAEQIQQNADMDYILFLLQELKTAHLSTNEYNELKKNIEMLEQKEQILSALTEINYHLVEKEDNVLSFFNKTISSIEHLSRIFPHLKEELEKFKNIQIELKEFNYMLSSIISDMDADPANLDSLHERLNVYERLLFKHRKKNVDELLDLQKELEAKLRYAEEVKGKMDELALEIQKLQEELIHQAKTLSENRQKAKSILEKNMSKALEKLGIPKAQFSVQLTKREELTRYGLDDVVFLFDANLTGRLQPLSQVASGGETSRLMLALKAQISSVSLLPTIIFDEIDVGISGEIAARVGEMLKELAKYHQIIAITHLPQVAARGQWHIEVSKNSDKSISTFTYVVGEARVEAISRLLADKNISDKTKEIARELLNF